MSGASLTTASIHYRLYQPADFGNLYAIEEVCFQPSERFTRRYMRELISSSESATWTAEQDGQLIGFAIVEWAQQLSGIVAYIPTIEVLPDWRGQGIGAELLRRIEDSARAEQGIAIWLHVDAENAPAIRLYERSGYGVNGGAENFYARNRPAAIYVKHLV